MAKKKQPKPKKVIEVPEDELDMFAKYGVKEIKMGSKTIKIKKK